MARTSIETKNPSEVEEVAAFEQAKQMLENYKASNEHILEGYRQIVEHYNQTREAAEQAVRGMGVRCGDFDLYQQLTKTNGDAVLNAVGREKFIAIGGTIKKKSEAKIGIKQLESALARGEIKQELFDEVTKVENRYHVPSAGALP